VSDSGSTDYPGPPWRLVGQLWLTLFRLPERYDELHPAGLYGAAFVDYQPGSVLTYSELLVARPVPVPGRRGPGLSITDIWVDSPTSMTGGRALWAIPKGLCDLDLDATRRGPRSTTSWAAASAQGPIARARFTDVSRAMVRTPFRATSWQPGLPDTDGEDRAAVVRGTAKVLPCRGRWDLAPDGPLAWLRPARPLASFRMADFRLSFG
jgi:acetoacetate decarboxylase